MVATDGKTTAKQEGDKISKNVLCDVWTNVTSAQMFAVSPE